ncbi:NAD-dependent epimerase/dehydratase family protein [Bacillus ndiopicus]|uniref:NAD-dependent epimerase/dehydratase family protein n=1 Tax=Bacillus ndiopicus TaxID=1347368 RepID=UPI0005AAF527|nr:NAD(P)-dependent oxidoreductase [Bacillus ndiopicus]
MNILVVGNTSIVGKRVIEQLKKNTKCIVYVTGRNKKADIFFDLENEQLEDNVKGYNFDVIINCAASFDDDSIKGSLKNLKINTMGAVKIVDLALNTKCRRIINLSSISMYSNKENEYYNSYGISKSFASEYFKLLCKQYNIDFCELLPSQIYDEAGEQKKHQGLLYSIIDQVSKKSEITFWGNLDVKRNYIFIKDLVNIIEKVIFSDITGSYPCCYIKSYTLSEIVKIASKVFEQKIQYTFDAKKESLKTIYIPETSYELYEQINYTPQVDLEKGLKLIKKTLYVKE